MPCRVAKERVAKERAVCEFRENPYVPIGSARESLNQKLTDSDDVESFDLGEWLVGLCGLEVVKN